MSAMVEVTKEDANNYCRVLTALGLEEGGDPVAEIERLRDRVTVLNLALTALLPVARTSGEGLPQEHARIVAMAEAALKA